MSPPSWLVVVPWVLSLATAGVGIFQFSVQQAQANRRPFLEQQMAVAIDATDIAARLATETDPVEWSKARSAFWRLYYGRLAIAEDRDVEARMVEFGIALQAAGVAPPTAQELPVQALARPSLQLAHAVRRLIFKSWRIKMPELEDERAAAGP